MHTASIPDLSKTLSYRSANIQRGGINEASRTIEVCFATENPCERSYGFEVLGCTETEADLSRMNDGGAFLKDHDTRNQIGVCAKAWIDPDHRARALLRFSKSEAGESEFREVLDSIRSKISLGYTVDVIEEVGEQDGLPVYRATKWTCLEISTVAVPADEQCAVGREHQSINQRTIMDPTTETTHRMTATQEAEHATKIREYVGALRNPSWKEKAEVIAERSILEGLTFKEFRERALPEFTTNLCLDTPFGESRQGRAINSGSGNHRTVGELVVTSPEFREMLKRGWSDNNPGVTIHIPKMDRFRVTSTRAVDTSGLAPTQREPGIVEDALRRVTVLDLLQSGTTTQKNVTYARESLADLGWTNNAAAVGEGSPKPESSLKIEEVTTAAKKIAHFITCSKEQLDDFPELRALIDTRMPAGVALEEERQVLLGDGMGNNLKGILSTPGILTRVVDNTTDASLAGSFYKALTDIRTSGPGGAGFEPDGYVINPKDWERLSLLKDFNGQFIGRGPLTGGTNVYGAPVPSVDMLWNKPVAVTPAIAQGKALAGAFSIGGKVLHREGINITIGTANDQFTRNLLSIIAESRLMLLVYLPHAFVELSGIV